MKKIYITFALFKNLDTPSPFMLLSITLFGFLVTFLLLINLRRTNKVNIYLFFFLLINNIYALSHFAAIYSGNKYLIAIMLVHFTPFYLLIGPLFYFYIRGLLMDDHKLEKSDLLHFIPALLFFINISPYVFSGWEHKLSYANNVIIDAKNLVAIDYIFMPPKISFLTRPIIALGYVIASVVLIIRRGLNENYLTYQAKLIYKWIVLLVVISIILYLGFLLFTAISFYTTNYQVATRQGELILYTTITGLILLNLSLLFFPNILYGLPQLDYAIVTKQNKAEEERLGIAEDVKKQNRSFEISNEKLNLLNLKIERYIEHKPYLSTDFNLTMMSADTDIPVHHLSYYFNEHLKINFNTWKNDLKIDHVIYLIRNGSGEILTLDALAKQAGFGSRTSFFNSFKQKVGVTPSEYLNNID
jgi:AraC-like DNA-binding protein